MSVDRRPAPSIVKKIRKNVCNGKTALIASLDNPVALVAGVSGFLTKTALTFVGYLIV